jgi:predicted XRE-type DNA-binding protein
MRGMEKGEMQTIAADIEAIKKLMILTLVQRGFKQKELASVLNVDEAILSKMFPKGLLKQAKGRKADE